MEAGGARGGRCLAVEPGEVERGAEVALGRCARRLAVPAVSGGEAEGLLDSREGSTELALLDGAQRVPDGGGTGARRVSGLAERLFERLGVDEGEVGCRGGLVAPELGK